MADQPEAWDQLANSSDDEVARERRRCAVIVTKEVEAGAQRGIPETSAVMRILRRIVSAIEHPS